MIFKNKKIYIDNQEVLISSAELHYFRISSSEWEQRILQVKHANFNCIATYIPWYLHEFNKGEYDFAGTRREYLNLNKFFELCQKHEMFIIARPGPYIMAEMMNEGLPDYIYDLEDIEATTWSRNKPEVPVIDYNNLEFLKHVEKYFKVLFDEVLSKYNNIIMMQLCNEIGMLQWITNTPNLNDNTRNNFEKYINDNFATSTIEKYGHSVSDIEKINEIKSLEFHNDFHEFVRNSYANYVDKLVSIWEKIAPDKYLYAVNIHGTGEGKVFGYPVGISQLYKTYKNKSNIVSGSDLYLGDFNVSSIQDSYILNAFTDASNGRDQPLMSIEFGSEDYNHGNDFSSNQYNHSLDMKIDMFYLQGNRLLNFYKIAGGINDTVDRDYKNGYNLFSNTGELDGTACPISPTGRERLMYHSIKNKLKFYKNFNNKVAKMQQRKSNVKIGFIVDYFMTEYNIPNKKVENEFITNLEYHRGEKFYSDMVKPMLLAGYSFDALDICNDPIGSEVLVIPSAKYMSKELQIKIVNALEAGTRVVFYGEVPIFDLIGNDCKILKDYLEIEIVSEVRSNLSIQKKVGLTPQNYDGGVLTLRDYAQLLQCPKSTGLIGVYNERHPAAVINNRFAFIACKYRSDIEFIDNILQEFGVKKTFSTDYPIDQSGIYINSIYNKNEEFIYIFNMHDHEKQFNVFADGVSLYDEELKVGGCRSVILPKNIDVTVGKVHFSTAQLLSESESELVFTETNSEFKVYLETKKKILPSDEYTVIEENEIFEIIAKPQKFNEQVTICFDSKKS